jgi:hypothetical protein
MTDNHDEFRTLNIIIKKTKLIFTVYNYITNYLIHATPLNKMGFVILNYIFTINNYFKK